MKRKTALLSTATPIQELAARMADVLCREERLQIISGRPEFQQRQRLLMRELQFAKEQILDLQPENRDDAIIHLMVAYDLASMLSARAPTDHLDQEDSERTERLAAGLRRLLRFEVDASGFDLRKVGGDGIMVEDDELEMFPELVDAKAV